MQIEIISPESLLYSGDVQQVRVPGSSGSFAVLHNHAPIMSTLEKGRIKVTKHGGQILFFDILSGAIQVKDNNITILVEKDNV
jgi:F-type H+-transporting ATPase subunit epsilon